MNLNALCGQLRHAVVTYRAATQTTSDEADKADYEDIAFLAEKLISQIEAGEIDGAKLPAFAFSRRVADGYATQPQEYKSMSEIIGRIRDMK